MKKITTLFISLFAVIFVNAQAPTNNSPIKPYIPDPVGFINPFNDLPRDSAIKFWDLSEDLRIGSNETQVQNSISDTIDILHYTVKLNITDFTTDTIRGGTIVKITPLINGVTTLPLDLLHMTIDSISDGTGLLFHSYNDTLLTISLAGVMNIGDTADIAVWYHGKPQLDPGPSVWGGFYFQPPYAYNLGVSFNANNHCFGRVFHPCFDNFVERASYTFVIGTNAGKLAYCNGVLGADTTDVNSIRWRTWDLAENIPSYLASISVATYTQVNWSHTGIYGTYPIILTALPSDTTNMKNSFVHLNSALSCFENRYGPYEWPRVGYCLVPFSSGAMEHATNISYPKVCANGSLTYEASIMAHELSHHWFGDLATCNNEGEMWLNEGWASYSEYVFTEWQYGHPAYATGIRDNHDEMVHLVHLREGGYLPLNTIPHAYTYGDNVYLRGADVAHCLRGYMGDSLFWLGLHYHLANSQYTDVTSVQFRDNLIAATGLTYLTDFFNDWVFNAGWPHFSIDSTVSVPNGPNFDVTVYVRQKLTGAPQYFTNVPLDFAFLKSDWSKTTSRQFISGQYSNFTVTLPYNPVMTAVDMDQKISDALTDEAQTISTIGAHNFTAARCSLTVVSIVDSAFVRIEHNYAKPDSIRNNTNNYRISRQRYWTIDGIFPATFITQGRFYYDGRTSTTAGPGNWLDNDLTPVNGDSIILMYKQNAGDDWIEYPHHYTKYIVGPAATSKYGYVTADTLMKGEYCFANGVSHILIGVQELPALPPEVFVYPNPAGNNLTIEWTDASNQEVLLNVYDMEGKLIFTQSMTGAQARLETSKWIDGYYNVEVIQQGKLLGRKQIMIIHE